MIIHPNISLFDLILTLSEAVDLVNPALTNHNLQVANIANKISKQIKLPLQMRNDIFLAGALHDIGALSIKDKLEALEVDYEMKNPNQHAESGYQLLKFFKPLANIANLIRFHHVSWDNGKGNEYMNMPVPAGSHILHLADRIAVLINRNEEILSQKDDICSIIFKGNGNLFNPEYVKSFMDLTKKEFFWIEAHNPDRNSIRFAGHNTETILLDIDSLSAISKIFSRIIDFRSKHTAAHSSVVASIAEALAGFYGFSKNECELMRISGYLHDLGKLSVSDEILDKPGSLSQNEINIMRKHTFYTYHLLQKIGLNQIAEWAAFHHERLDGNGYPFHLEENDISIGSRIMAVADIYTALTEDRSYRKAMSRNEAFSIINDISKTEIDFRIVKTLNDNIDEIEQIRIKAHEESLKEYEQII